VVWDHQRLECRYRPVIMAHIVMGVGHVVARGLNGAVEHGHSQPREGVSGAESSERLFVEGTGWSRTLL